MLSKLIPGIALAALLASGATFAASPATDVRHTDKTAKTEPSKSEPSKTEPTKAASKAKKHRHHHKAANTTTK